MTLLISAALVVFAAFVALGNTLMKYGASGGGRADSHLDRSFVLETLLAPATIAGVAFSGIGAIIYIWILRSLDLSKALPIGSGLILTFVTLFSLLFFREPLGVGRVVGICVNFLGVLIVARN